MTDLDMAREALGHAFRPAGFGDIPNLTNVEKVSAIETMIDAKVRAILAEPTDIASLRAKLAKAREALAFYRDAFQYVPRRTKTGVNLSTWKPKESLLDDCGERARAAYEETGQT